MKQRVVKGEETERKLITSTNEKSLQLMNELNVANSRVEELRKEIKDTEKQLGIVEKENDDIRGEKIALKKELERVNCELLGEKQKSAEGQLLKAENKDLAKRV